jgi:hypothetical protein
MLKSANQLKTHRVEQVEVTKNAFKQRMAERLEQKKMDKKFENNQLQRAASFCSDHTDPVSKSKIFFIH